MKLNNYLTCFFINRLPLATKISVQMGVPVLLALVLLVSTAVVMVRDEEIDKVNEQARLLAANEAGSVSAYINEAATTTRELATSIECLAGRQSGDRQTISAVMQDTLTKNPRILSVWCAFEPNTLAEPDSKYINTAYGNDIGRFTTGFNTARGYVSRDITNEEKMLPGDGDWYVVPKKNGKETLVDPTFWSYYENTPEYYSTTYAMPVVRKGKIIGVAGIDLGLDDLTKVVSKIKPYGTGYVVAIANNGTYATHPVLSMRGKDIGNSAEMKRVKEAVKAGQQVEFNYYDKTLREPARAVVVPVSIGDADSKWALMVIIPTAKAMAPVTRLTEMCLAVAVVALFGVLVAVVMIAKRIVRPIDKLSSVAKSLATGDIDTAEKLIKS